MKKRGKDQFERNLEQMYEYGLRVLESGCPEDTDIKLSLDKQKAIDTLNEFGVGDVDADDFFFSDGHKNLLKEALQNYEPTNVERFIKELEKNCAAMMVVQNLKKQSDRYKSRIECALKTFKKSLKQVERLSGSPQSTIYFLEDGLVGIPNINKVSKKAQRVQSHLEDLVNDLKIQLAGMKANSKRGRKSSWVTLGIGKMAESYSQFLGKPTTYIDGPFADIVRISLEALGLPAKDPSRAMRAAVRRMKTE